MQFLQAFIYNNFLISFSAGALAYACATRIGNPHNIGIGCLVFFATLAIYNLQRLLQIKDFKNTDSVRHLWIIKHSKKIKLLSFIGFSFSLLIYFFVLGWNPDFWLLSFSAIYSILYALKIIPKIGALRDLPYLKIYLIAFQWTIVCVLWPFLRVAKGTSFPLFLALSVFFFILAATVPFDIRDIRNDKRSKKTIPQLAGIKGAKTISSIFLLISGLSLCLAFKNSLHHPLFYLVYIGAFILIIKSSPQRKEMYFSGIIDSWVSLYALLLVVI